MLLKVDSHISKAERSVTQAIYTCLQNASESRLTPDYGTEINDMIILHLKKKKKKVVRLHMHLQKPRTGHIPNWKRNKLQNMSRSIYDCFSQRSQADRQHNHLRWKAALKDTVAGNLTHVTGGQLVHLCSDAVLLHQWFLREADMQHVTNCSHYPVSYDYVECNMLQTVHITLSVMILSVHITLPFMIL